jgi:hypothetical protein
MVIGIPIIVIFAGKHWSIYSQTTATEYWNSYVVKATYYEDWDEWITKECCHENCSGSGDDRSCTEECHDCSYREDHPEYWEMYDNIGNSYRISRAYFNELVKKWGNKTFQDMNRDYYEKDGNAYNTSYKGIFETTVPVCFIKTYENRVKASKSVFNFQDVDTADVKNYRLFNYPGENKFNFNPILGYTDQAASEKLSKYNALNGAGKQIHMMILVYDNQPQDAGVLQESYWKGGNKNEFILCIGKSGNKIKWTKVISWTEVEDLKIRVARVVKEMDTLNIETVVNYMGSEVPKKFVRKRFRDFNYLTIEPTNKAIVITMIVTILVSVGLAVIAVKDDIDRG